MTYVRAKDGMAFRLSDSQTLTWHEYIICQKPIPTEQIEQDDSTNVLIQMTMGICNRDLQSVVETTMQAIDQIELITSLKLNISEQSNTLNGFLPNFQQENARPKRSITFSSSSSSSSSSNFSTTSSPSTGFENSTVFQNLTSPLPPIKEFFTNNDTCRRLSDAFAFWCPLWTENEFRVKTKLIPSLAPNVTFLFEQTYHYWFYLQTKNLTYASFHSWLDEELSKRNIVVCSYSYAHICMSSDRRMYPLYPRAINRYRYNPRIDYLVNPKNPLDMYSVNRTTRELGTMTAATIVGTLVGGSAYIIKSFIDLIRTDKYATKADLAKTTHQIEDLRINQIEMQKAISHIAAQTIANQNEIRQLYNGVAAQNIEV
jgi:hypothetical protein